MDTTGPRKCVLIREASLFQRLIHTLKYTIGTSATVLIREGSLFQRREVLVSSRALGFKPLFLLQIMYAPPPFKSKWSGGICTYVQ